MMTAAELVNAATSYNLTETDWTKNIEICELVDKDQRQARDVVKAIKKRLGEKHPNTQFFAVMLLEMLMNIGEHIHKQVIDTGIIPILVKIVKKKSDFPVRERIFLLLNATQTSLGGASGKFPQYYNAYYGLVSDGVQFPQRAQVIQSNHPSLQSSRTTNVPNREQAEPRHEGVVQHPLSQTVSESSIIQKASNALKVLKEVLDAVDAQHPQPARDEFTLDLVEQCSFQKQRVMEIVRASRDERIVSRAIELNEQLQKVLSRHDDLLSGRATTIGTCFDHEEAEEEEPDQLVRRLRKGKACARLEDKETNARITPLGLLEGRHNRPLIRPLSLEPFHESNTRPPAMMLQPPRAKRNGEIPRVAILPPPAKHAFCSVLSKDNPEDFVESKIQIQNRFQDLNLASMASDPLIKMPIQKSQFQSLLQSSLQNQGQCQNPMNDPMSLYFLHPSESPDAMLISFVLTPQIYHTWARAMRWALKSKNKLPFIDGTLPRPDEVDPFFVAWDRCNTYVVSWINQTLSAEILQSVIGIEEASILWKNLEQRYYQGDLLRVAVLQEELFAVKQGELSITAYFKKLKSMWEELENFRPIPGCSCGEICNCGLGVIRSYRQSDYVIRFLRGLNEQYANVGSQIMLMQPLPDINEAFSLLSQQERQVTTGIYDSKMLLSAEGQNQHSLAFRGRARGRGGRGEPANIGGRDTIGRGQSLRVCVYRKMTGHTIENCYRKHGFHPHMQQTQSSINNLTAEDVDGGSDTSENEVGQMVQGIVSLDNNK